MYRYQFIVFYEIYRLQIGNKLVPLGKSMKDGKLNCRS